jgi:hypothetical protein
MALDALAEVVLRFVGEVVFVGLFYWPGWLVLRIITLGRYPPLKDEPHSKEFVAAFGFCTILVCALMNIPGGGL